MKNFINSFVIRDGKVNVGNSPSESMQTQNKAFQVLIPEMVKLSSSWSHGKKVLKDQEKRISPSPLESYSGIQDIVSPSD